LTAKLANLLVHEATHGRIHSMGVGYGKENYERVERLCCKQEYYHRCHVSDGETDLLGMPIDWQKQTAFEPRKQTYDDLFSLSPFQRRVNRIRHLILFLMLGPEALEKYIGEIPNQQGGVNRWSCKIDEYSQWFDQVPPTSPNRLLRTAYAHRSCGQYHAAIRCFDCLQETVQSPTSDATFYHATLLHLTRQLERAEAVWSTLEADEKIAGPSREWRSVTLRNLKRFDEASILLDELDATDFDTENVLKFRMKLELIRGNLDAGEKLMRLATENEPILEVDHQDFWLYTLPAMIAWHRGDGDAFDREIAVLDEARSRWLELHQEVVVRRRAMAIDPPESMRSPRIVPAIGIVPAIITVLLRMDREIEESQTKAAKQLATRIECAMSQVLFDGPDAYLQGLGYGDDEILLREIDWSRLDPSERLDGTWCIAELQAHPVFLDQCVLPGESIDLWMLPSLGETETRFVPCGKLTSPETAHVMSSHLLGFEHEPEFKLSDR